MSNFSMTQERDVLREPYFKITFNGVAVPYDEHDKIVEVKVEDSDNELDSAKITIHDDESYYFVNNKSIVKGASITIDLGNKHNHRIMLNGKITSVECDFQANGIASLVIGAIDSGVSMAKGKKSRKWEKIKKSDVIKKVVAENGWYCRVTETQGLLPQVTQQNENDLEFINRLAKEEGFKFHRVNEGNYFWGVIDDKNPPIATLNYYCKDYSILSAKVDFVDTDNTAKQSSDIDSKTGSTENKTEKTDDKSKKPLDVKAIDKKYGNEKTIQVLNTGNEFMESLTKKPSGSNYGGR